MTISNIVLGGVIGATATVIIIVLIAIWKRLRDGGHLFLGGHRQSDLWRDDPDKLGDRKQWLHPDDGVAGGNRGRVWTALERSEYRQARERKKLRIVGNAHPPGNMCPPHDPEYDETVNETYCSRCLTRLPNQ